MTCAVKRCRGRHPLAVFYLDPHGEPVEVCSRCWDNLPRPTLRARLGLSEDSPTVPTSPPSEASNRSMGEGSRVGESSEQPKQTTPTE